MMEAPAPTRANLISAGRPSLWFVCPPTAQVVPVLSRVCFMRKFYAKGRDFHEASLSFFFIELVAGSPTGPGG